MWTLPAKSSVLTANGNITCTRLTTTCVVSERVIPILAAAIHVHSVLTSWIFRQKDFRALAAMEAGVCFASWKPRALFAPRFQCLLFYLQVYYFTFNVFCRHIGCCWLFTEDARFLTYHCNKYCHITKKWGSPSKKGNVSSRSEYKEGSAPKQSPAGRRVSGALIGQRLLLLLLIAHTTRKQ